MILGEDGERLSKRHGAVSVMQYLDSGYLPEALNNFLSRLGWAHGDEEIFSMKQFVEWFDLRHISRSPARFNAEKLLWLNAQYLKGAGDARLAALMRPFLEKTGCDPDRGPLAEKVAALLKERVNTVEELADAAVYFYRRLEPAAALREQHYMVGLGRAMDELRNRFAHIDWNRVTIQESLKQVVAAHGLKMPRLAMPLRLIVTGEAQTPAIDAVLEVLGREETLARMDAERPRLPD
jgi:glutamyl-tRNA synthetase